MQHYNQALRLNPDHTQALLNRAALHNLNKNIPAARADLNTILRLDPNNAQVRALLMQLNTH
jgi:predicted TPR repeat methyltransferase